jgi:hypothetical protein
MTVSTKIEGDPPVCQLIIFQTAAHQFLEFRENRPTNGIKRSFAFIVSRWP